MKANVFVKTKNVKQFVSLMESLKKLPPNIPKLALVYGSHGLGKTKTALFHYSNSPQKSFKKQHLLVWLSGRAPPW